MSTNISWADETWNPLVAVRSMTDNHYVDDDELRGWACVKVSPGCANCYASEMNETRRFGLGTGLPYTVWAMSQATPILDEAALAKPLRWRNPRRIFVCSMTDLFGEWVRDEWLDRIFAVMEATPHHTYLILTKRPERMREVVRSITNAMGFVNALKGGGGPGWVFPNVHLGVSCEDQERWDERVPVLLDTPAAVRWVSAEPLLGPIDGTRTNIGDYELLNAFKGFVWSDGSLPDLIAPSEALDWIVVGGESGRGFRPMDVEWAGSLVRQCKTAGVPVWFKQGSGIRPQMVTTLDGMAYHELPVTR